MKIAFVKTFKGVEQKNMPAMTPRKRRENPGRVAFINSKLNQIAWDIVAQNLIDVQPECIESGEIAAVRMPATGEPQLQERFVVVRPAEVTVRVRAKFQNVP